MRIISRKTLRDYWEVNHQSEAPLREWFAFVEKATWASTQDVRRDFSSASFVANNRIVFNIGGNNYRLVAVALFGAPGTIYIRFIGTHQEYDRIDVTEV